MNYLSVENLSKSFGDTALFEDVTFGIAQGQKVALVGVNGSGKSTLLKIIMGLDEPDTGEVSFRNGLKVSNLTQNPQFVPGHTVVDAIFEGDDPVLSLVKDYQKCLALSETDPAEAKRLMELVEKMDAANAWDYESEAKQVLGRLGIHNLSQPVERLSGGQQKRVGLAKVLIEKPDFLIMDEPTNHLDLDTIEWLEEYLSDQAMSLLLVTHDRYFLERVTNEIKEIDQGRLFGYSGNYTYFLEKKAEREQQQATEVEKARNLMKKELEWIRRQPKARGTKAKYRIDAFEETKKKATQKTSKAKLELDVKARRQGGKIMEISQIAKSFGDKAVVQPFSYVFKKGDRIGIVGKNGAGKTTFLNMLTGALTPDHGEIEKGATVAFGYYQQGELDFKPGQKVIDIVKDEAEVITMSDGRQVTASQFLQHFMFPPKKQHDFVEKLSGGEKRRLQLMRVLIKAPNFLILDEPTNDIDLVTLATLEEFLHQYKGCLIIVSHDRYFMDRLVEHIFVFEEGKPIRDFPGNFTQLRESDKAVAQMVKNTAPPKEKPKQEKEKTPQKRKMSFNEKREFESLEGEIAALEKEKAAILEKLNTGEGGHEELTQWGRDMEAVTAQIEEKEMRWLELSELEN